MAKGGKFLFGMIFSFSGFILLTIVGALLKIQPEFMKGAKNPKTTANACFQAAALYALVSAGCYYMYKRGIASLSDLTAVQETTARERSYYELSDSEEELPLALHMSPAERTYSKSPSPNTTKSL